MADSNPSGIHTNGVNGKRDVDFEALVIGAGFGGIRMLHELRKRGLSAKAFEAGSGIGGTVRSPFFFLRHSEIPLHWIAASLFAVYGETDCYFHLGPFADASVS